MNDSGLVRHDGVGHVPGPPAYWGAGYTPEIRESEGLLGSWRVVLSHKWTVLVVTICCLAAAVGVTKLEAPAYRAHTLITVKLRNEYFLNQREIDPTLTTDSGETYLQTQTQILQSESMIKRALSRLNVPVPNRSSMVSRLIERVRPQTEPSLTTSTDDIASLAADLSARPLHPGDVIEATFVSPDRFFAAAFLNALTASFIQENVDARHEVGKLTQGELRVQLDQVKADLEASEKALQDYAGGAGLLFTSQKTSVAEDQLRSLEQELAAARADRILKESHQVVAASSAPSSLPSVLDDLTLRDYQVRLVDLRRQRAELLAHFTPNHPEVKALDVQIQEVQSWLKSQQVDVVERVRNEYDAAVRREASLAAAVADQTRRVAGDSVNSVRYNVLQREVETRRALYDTMLQRASNSWLASATDVDNIRVIDPASTPRWPYQPNVLQNAAIGGVGGIIFGTFLVLLMEGKNPRIRSPLDLRSPTYVQQLGIVPHVKLKQQTSQNPADLVWGTKAADGASFYDAFADSFRATVASIASANRNGSFPQTIIVTSPTAADGKTTVSVNLGAALAEIKHRVLLIDADTRNPSIHGAFGVRNTVGLTDVLRGNVELNKSLYKCIYQRPFAPESPGAPEGPGQAIAPGLYVLSRGAACKNATPLFYSDRMESLLRQTRADFDIILIDTPPMLALPHARVLAKHAEGVVLVLRAGQTPALLAREALARLRDDFIPMLGVVLNSYAYRRARYAYYES